MELPPKYSALNPEVLGADDETRTRDPHLGKVMRYQLRYIRTHCAQMNCVGLCSSELVRLKTLMCRCGLSQIATMLLTFAVVTVARMLIDGSTPPLKVPRLWSFGNLVLMYLSR